MNKVLTEKEVAAILDCSQKTVAKMAKTEGIPFIKVGNERRYPQTTFEEWLIRKARENCSGNIVSRLY